MKYEVEYAIGYDHGGWESFIVEVEMPPVEQYIAETYEGYRQWEDELQEAAGNALLEKQGPNTHEVFCVVLDYHRIEDEENS